MAIHPETIAKYDGSMEELASDVSKLRYDTLALFLETLSSKIGENAKKDRARGRPKLAAALSVTAEWLLYAHFSVEEAWSISRPHTRH